MHLINVVFVARLFPTLPAELTEYPVRQLPADAHLLMLVACVGSLSPVSDTSREG